MQAFLQSFLSRKFGVGTGAELPKAGGSQHLHMKGVAEHDSKIFLPGQMKHCPPAGKPCRLRWVEGGQTEAKCTKGDTSGTASARTNPWKGRYCFLYK